MTKKDFQMIADVLARAAGGSPDDENMREYLARAFANMLADANPRFDRARFLTACKVAL